MEDENVDGESHSSPLMFAIFCILLMQPSIVSIFI